MTQKTNKRKLIEAKKQLAKMQAKAAELEEMEGKHELPPRQLEKLRSKMRELAKIVEVKNCLAPESGVYIDFELMFDGIYGISIQAVRLSDNTPSKVANRYARSFNYIFGEDMIFAIEEMVRETKPYLKMLQQEKELFEFCRELDQEYNYDFEEIWFQVLESIK